MLLKVDGEAFVCGFVARDAEVRYTGTGRKVANFSVRVSGGFDDEPAVWLRCVAWGDRADLAEQIRKGDSVFAAGRLNSRRWTGNDGEQRTTEEFTCNFLAIEGRPFGGAEPLPFGTRNVLPDGPAQLGQEFMEEHAKKQGTVFADEDLPF